MSPPGKRIGLTTKESVVNARRTAGDVDDGGVVERSARRGRGQGGADDVPHERRRELAPGSVAQDDALALGNRRRAGDPISVDRRDGRTVGSDERTRGSRSSARRLAARDRRDLDERHRRRERPQAAQPAPGAVEGRAGPLGADHRRAQRLLGRAERPVGGAVERRLLAGQDGAGDAGGCSWVWMSPTDEPALGVEPRVPLRAAGSPRPGSPPPRATSARRPRRPRGSAPGPGARPRASPPGRTGSPPRGDPLPAAGSP